MAAVLVGSKSSSSAGPLTPGGGTTTTGSTFVIVVSHGSGVSLSTALNSLDNKGNTYVLSPAGVVTASGHKKAIYYCTNGTGGASHSCSLAFSGSPDGTAYLIEIPLAATSSFDVDATASPGTSPYTVATGTMAQALNCVITVIGNGDGDNPMNYASSNTTVLSQEGNGAAFWTSAVSAFDTSSTTSYVPSFTSAQAGTTHLLITAVFKYAGSAAGNIAWIIA